MNRIECQKLAVPVLIGFALALTSSANAQETKPKINIALGKTVTFSNAPNYSLCTDPDDSKQLTDGRYGSEGEQQQQDNSKALWVQKGTVGWQNVSPVIITIDLGSVQAIGGASYSTAAGGGGGVTWPIAIYMAVSDDDQTWHAAGDLVQLSRENGTPPAQGYATFRYTAHGLRSRGRYISFAVVATPYVFTDEIEVFKGDDAWVSRPTRGEAMAHVKEYAAASLVRSAAQRRLYDDIDAVRMEMNKAGSSAARKAAWNSRLDKDATQVEQMPQLSQDFQTILPLDETHCDILAVRGEVLEAGGIAPLAIWKMHRYSRLSYWAHPTGSSPTLLSFSMLRNQFRSDDLLLTDASGKAKTVAFRLKDPPRDAQDGWLRIDSVAWTDTSGGTAVADALIPVNERNGIYRVDVPAGMTRKVWFTVDSSKVPPGDYRCAVETESVDRRLSIPFTLQVSRIAMNKPRLSLTMWDYANGEGHYNITPQNRMSAIAMMRSHYVNSPWASSGVLPHPQAGEFDARDNLTKELDFSSFDRWIAMWRGAAHYFVFADVPGSFAGAGMSTPEFDSRVGSWAKALSRHMKALNLQPRQLGLCLLDEPYHESQDAVIAAWAKAINAAAPELTLFSDPRWERPDQTKIQKAITTMDILCPSLPLYIDGGEPVQNYFEKLRLAGKNLWFYQADGPSWQLDPQLYYRYQAWHAFSADATGEGFWSFCDAGGKAPTSWNGYSITRVSYAPAFLGKETVNDSIQWDAVREGVEDYEELAMLQDAVSASHDDIWKTRAKKTLIDAVKAVAGLWSEANYTTDNVDPRLADTQLQKVQDVLSQEPARKEWP